METLLGEVVSIVYSDPETNFVVCRLKSKQEPGIVTVVGSLGNIIPGTEVTLQGQWRLHPKFGRQFQATWCEQSLPATAVGIKRYLSSGMIKGVGPVLAERLIEKFGNKVLHILDKDPKRLLEIPGIGEKTLEKIVSSWEEQREIRNIIMFLQEHSVPPSYAVKIYRTYGKDSLSVLKERPYDLAYDIKGIGFKTADTIALKLGFPKDSLQRIEAGIVYTLFTMSEKGHVYYPKDKLIEEVSKVLDINNIDFIEDAISSLINKKRIFCEDIGSEKKEEAIYLAHFYKWEKEIASRLKEMIIGIGNNVLLHQNIEDKIRELEDKIHISLSEEQRDAVIGALKNQVFIITGGPGTGKTTITRFIVTTLKKFGMKVLLCAPTGRAAKRLSEATGFDASTVHKLLGFGPSGEFQYGDHRKLKTNCVILDEASMVDCHLFVSLLRALPLTAKLILVGDVNQLPSVGPGNILEDLIKSQVVPIKELTTIYRQAKKSMIVINAHRVNEGKFPIRAKEDPPKGDFFWMEEDNVQRIQNVLISLVIKRIPQLLNCDPIRDIQVLSPMHKGDVGTMELNKLLQKHLNSSNRAIKYCLKGFRLGDKIIQTKNNYEKEVFNGDVGIISEVNLELGELTVDFDGRRVLYDQSELDEISLAYCISIHKSQGSEYPVVLFPVVMQHYIMLYKNLIYTALTRAKRLAVILGSRKAMAIGLKNKNKEERFTYLASRLRNQFF